MLWWSTLGLNRVAYPVTTYSGCNDRDDAPDLRAIKKNSLKSKFRLVFTSEV